MKKNLLLFFAISCVANALAAHIEFDTPEAHVVIVRPSDLWSGDTSSMEKNLDAIKEKKFSFTYKVDGIIQNGNPMIFGSISNHPVVQGVVKRIEKNGWKLGYSENRHSLWIDQAVPIKPSDIKDFMAIPLHTSPPSKLIHLNKQHKRTSDELGSRRIQDDRTRRRSTQQQVGTAARAASAKALGEHTRCLQQLGRND